jgi:hypothetical protein
MRRPGEREPIYALMAMVCSRICLPLRVKLLHGAFPRSRPYAAFLWSTSYPGRCVSVLRQQAPIPLGKTSRGHRTSRRTHYVLLSHRHLPSSERRSFSPCLALLALAPLVTTVCSLASLPGPMGTPCRFSLALTRFHGTPWYIVSLRDNRNRRSAVLCRKGGRS